MTLLASSSVTSRKGSRVQLDAVGLSNKPKWSEAVAMRDVIVSSPSATCVKGTSEEEVSHSQ